VARVALDPVEEFAALVAGEASIDRHALYARLRAERPVFFSESLQAWVLTRYDDVRLVLEDEERFIDLEQSALWLGEETEERYPVADRRTGRVTYEIRTIQYGARPIPIIRDCCSRKSGFITPDMAALEVIFRILLANANQPMQLSHLREQLREWCPNGRCQWLLMPLEVLQQVVDHDQFYGLRRYELPVAV